MTYHQNGFSKMFSVLILFSCFFAKTVTGREPTCLTGYMTDIQSWVDRFGQFTPYVDKESTLDLSRKISPLTDLRHFLREFPIISNNRIRFFSMARCRLQQIPDVFNLQDNHSRSLAETVEYVTFYGNDFSMTYLNSDKYHDIINETIQERKSFKNLSVWGEGFKGINFENLLQLDLRACEIQSLATDTFYSMSKLSMLYLSENSIHYIEANAFSRLKNLKHLDLSRNNQTVHINKPVGFNFENRHEFQGSKLESLDFSFSRFGYQNLRMFQDLKNLKRLSLCYSGINRLIPSTFDKTSLRFLDVSGNRNILNASPVFRGIRDSLQVLYAEEVALKNMDCLFNLKNLEIAQLRRNEIAAVTRNVSISLKKLQVLDLGSNRLLSWNWKVFSLMPNLKLLSVNRNSINVVSQEMLDDFYNLSYIDLSNNRLVCSCYVREIHGISFHNEFAKEPSLIQFLGNDYKNDFLPFQTGLNDFNNIILNRRNTTNIHGNRTEGFDRNIKGNGNYVLIIDDGDMNSHRCLSPSEGKLTNIDRINCAPFKRGYDVNESVKKETKMFLLFLIPVILLPILLFIFIYRKNLRYFWIMMKNSTMLSLISRDEVINESTIFNYDAFISYCNEDRAWVLDNFLPRVEQDCNISVCLHERDFQVGLSILENIVSCMDRSSSIILIISKRFLLSQWCQFEMHLAQHRLLETRREDLILVLLEEIPRRLRPNTLHYLMVTKTYIVWPSDETERNVFWKRLKKSIVTLKLKHTENVSVA